MKKVIFVALSSLALALNPVWASDGTQPSSKGSMFLTGQIGLNTMVRTADPFADPFNTMIFPLGAGFEFMLTRHIGIGGTIMYERWSDYLGMFGGEWIFRLVKPSFDFAYHFGTERAKTLDFFAGAHLGYSFVAVSNMIGNNYDGNLRSEPHLAPFVGANFHFWRNSPGFLGRLSATFRVAWSVTGHFSDVYSMAGLTYRFK